MPTLSVEARAPSTPFPLSFGFAWEWGSAVGDIIPWKWRELPSRLALSWDALGGEWCRSHLPQQQVLRVQELFPPPCRRDWKSEGKGSNTIREKGKENPASLLPGEQRGNKHHTGICPVIKSTSVFYNQLQGFITKTSGFPRGLCAQTTIFPGVHKIEVEFWKGYKPPCLGLCQL